MSKKSYRLDHLKIRLEVMVQKQNFCDLLNVFPDMDRATIRQYENRNIADQDKVAAEISFYIGGDSKTSLTYGKRLISILSEIRKNIIGSSVFENEIYALNEASKVDSLIAKISSHSNEMSARDLCFTYDLVLKYGSSHSTNFVKWFFESYRNIHYNLVNSLFVKIRRADCQYHKKIITTK